MRIVEKQKFKQTNLMNFPIFPRSWSGKSFAPVIRFSNGMLVWPLWERQHPPFLRKKKRLCSSSCLMHNEKLQHSSRCVGLDDFVEVLMAIDLRWRAWRSHLIYLRPLEVFAQTSLKPFRRQLLLFIIRTTSGHDVKSGPNQYRSSWRQYKIEYYKFEY